MEKTVKKNKVLNTIVNVLLVVAILLGIFCSFTAFVTKSGSGVPSLFGIRPFAVQSESMEPFFYKGDLIVDTVVKDPSTLQPGDVITFWTVIQGKRVLNTHRILEINDYDSFLSFVTKGDNNTMEDSMTVHQSEIVGKYAFRIPAVGSFIDFLQTPTGFGLVIVLPCALFFLYQLVSFFRALFAYQSEKMRLQLQQQMAQQMTAQSADPVKNTATVEESVSAEDAAKEE